MQNGPMPLSINVEENVNKLVTFSAGPRYFEEPFRDCVCCRKNIPHRKAHLLPFAVMGSLPIAMLVLHDQMPTIWIALFMPLYMLVLLIANSYVVKRFEEKARNEMHARLDKKNEKIQRVTRALCIAHKDYRQRMLGPESPLSVSMEHLDRLLQKARVHQHDMRVNDGDPELLQETVSCMARLYGKRMELRARAANISRTFDILSAKSDELHRVANADAKRMDLLDESFLLKDCGQLMQIASKLHSDGSEAAKRTHIGHVMRESCDKTPLDLNTAEQALNQYLAIFPKIEVSDSD